MTKHEQIQELIQEAQSNLTLYTSGQDDYALKRYQQIMEYVRFLENTSNS